MRVRYFIIAIVIVLFLCGCGSNDVSDPLITSAPHKQEIIDENGEDVENTETDIESIFTDFKRHENGIYFDSERYAENKIPFYFEKEDNGEPVREYIWFESGTAHKIIQTDNKINFLAGANHIELFEDSKTGEYEILCWLEYRLVIDGYVFYIDSGNLGIETLNKNDVTWLDFACKNLQYKDGYIYYLRRESKDVVNNLYRIKPDGTEKEQVSSVDSLDYCLTENGVLHLVNSYGAISIRYQDFSEGTQISELGKFHNKDYHIYQVTGVIDDVIYISVTYSETILDTSEVEIYAFKDIKLELVHTSNAICDIEGSKPFVYRDYIYYKTAEGLFEFDPSDGSCVKIAEIMFAFGQIK